MRPTPFHAWPCAHLEGMLPTCHMPGTPSLTVLCGHRAKFNHVHGQTIMSDTNARAPSASRRKQDVDELLADLNIDIDVSKGKLSPNRNAAGSRPQGAQAHSSPAEAESVLDDLEGMVQRRRYSPSSRTPAHVSSPSNLPHISPNIASAAAGVPPSSPSLPNAAQQSLAPSASVPPAATTSAQVAKEEQQADAASGDALAGGWGQWGSLLSSASRFAGQARHELERRAAEIRGEEAQGELSLQHLSERFSKGVRGIVADANLNKFGHDISAVTSRGWNDILNVVAPPMEAHEMVQVSLSYDLSGITGIESTAFRVLMRVLQQVDVHDVTVVRVGTPTQAPSDTPRYNLAVSASRTQGLAAARVRVMLTRLKSMLCSRIWRLAKPATRLWPRAR